MEEVARAVEAPAVKKEVVGSAAEAKVAGVMVAVVRSRSSTFQKPRFGHIRAPPGQSAVAGQVLHVGLTLSASLGSSAAMSTGLVAT